MVYYERKRGQLWQSANPLNLLLDAPQELWGNAVDLFEILTTKMSLKSSTTILQVGQRDEMEREAAQCLANHLARTSWAHKINSLLRYPASSFLGISHEHHSSCFFFLCTCPEKSHEWKAFQADLTSFSWSVLKIWYNGGIGCTAELDSCCFLFLPSQLGPALR